MNTQEQKIEALNYAIKGYQASEGEESRKVSMRSISRLAGIACGDILQYREFQDKLQDKASDFVSDFLKSQDDAQDALEVWVSEEADCMVSYYSDCHEIVQLYDFMKGSVLQDAWETMQDCGMFENLDSYDDLHFKLAYFIVENQLRHFVDAELQCKAEEFAMELIKTLDQDQDIQGIGESVENAFSDKGLDSSEYESEIEELDLVKVYFDVMADLDTRLYDEYMALPRECEKARGEVQQDIWLEVQGEASEAVMRAIESLLDKIGESA